MKYSLLSVLYFSAVQVFASGTVDFLEVDNNVVLFSTTATKAVASPTCVSTDSSKLWSTSLESHSGRAIYSLILTSMSTGSALSIQSADDCADREGVERASKVSLAVTSVSNGSSATYGMKLAPDLDFPSTRTSTSHIHEIVLGINASGKMTEALSLTGKHIISYLSVNNTSAREDTKVRLTIDNQVIFDDVVQLSQIRLVGDLDYPEPIVVENSFLLEVETVTDTDFNLVYIARPIQ